MIYSEFIVVLYLLKFQNLTAKCNNSRVDKDVFF